MSRTVTLSRDWTRIMNVQVSLWHLYPEKTHRGPGTPCPIQMTDEAGYLSGMITDAFWRDKVSATSITIETERHRHSNSTTIVSYLPSQPKGGPWRGAPGYSRETEQVIYYGRYCRRVCVKNSVIFSQCCTYSPGLQSLNPSQHIIKLPRQLDKLLTLNPLY